MKIALVLPGSIWYAPYVRIYTKILDELHADYAIISWNREGDDKPEGFQYNVPCAKGHGSAGWKAYKGYIKFIKKTIKEQGFERIIVFGPQMTCMLCAYLLLHFRGRYMIDYRDLSIEQKAGFKQLFAVMLKFSKANVISSPGFKRCLPKRDYYLSHNFDINAVKAAFEEKVVGSFETGKEIEVLTIGAIRDYSSNIEVVKALGNKEGITVSFVGKGSAAERIAEYCKKEGIENVKFTGFYQKHEEAGYVKSATFMNIFYPRIITHDTALSNRFYNSLIYRKPMIVTKDTTQGDYAERYGVGLALETTEGLAGKLKDFLKQDYAAYCERCNSLLSDFINDYNEFYGAVKQFVSA